MRFSGLYLLVFIVRSSDPGPGGFVDEFTDTLDGGRGKIEQQLFHFD